ncbi:acyl-CoA dehydrogenase [Nocardia callitridis]|uniref:Acyl-CoA dehydrogenase n=1 Tax=Nocardia callitridis TaxID=648753 RepID=A0ABP9K3G9_9NOCA
MGIAVTEDHLELARVVRSFLAERGARGRARELLDAESEQLPAFWSELGGVGWLGLHIPEEFGGSGFGLPELVVVAAEFGAAVAPGPFVPTVIASAVIAKYGSREQKSRLLPVLTDGSEVAGFGRGGSAVVNGGVAEGETDVVLGAGLADVLVLAVGADVLIVEPARPGVAVEVPDNLDPTRRSGRVRLRGVELESSEIIAGAAEFAVAVARTLVSAEAVGGAQDALESAVEYAKVREQFGRTIGTFQAVKHHCANMLVHAETGVATVWDAARAATEDDEQFRLIAAAASTLALAGYVHNAELNIQVHGGIGFTWEHDAHLHLRRAATLAALFGGQDGPRAVFDLAVGGVRRANSLDLPEHAETLRAQVAQDVAEIVGLDDAARRRRLIATGYVMPHWPKPWGRAADAVQQLVIEQEFARAGLERPDFGITGWVILTLIQHGTQDQIDRFVLSALRGEEVWCQLFSEPNAGSDAAAVRTRATRVDGGWVLNGQKVWTSGAKECRRGLATVRTDPDAPKHRGITTVLIDMDGAGVEVRPLRQITGGSDFNEVFFTDVFVPDSDVVGEPNAGWTVARATLGNERVSIGGGLAGDEGATKLLIGLAESAQDRVTGTPETVGRFLATDQALRLLNLRRAARSIAGGAPGPEGNVTKLLLAEHIGDRARISARLLGDEVALASGAAGLVGKMLLGARGMTIAGGTSEIARNQIAERILGLPRDPLIK